MDYFDVEFVSFFKNCEALKSKLLKLYLTTNDLLPVLLGNEEDLGHEKLSKHLLVLPSVQSV